MIKEISIKGFLLILLLTFTSYSFAQKQFQHLTSADGISQSEVYSFLEDTHGFMWFGTVDGLNRYDGYDVTVFNIDKDNPNSITNNTIRSLVEDDLGRIWIGTDDGLCVYDSKMEKIHQVPLKNFGKSRLTVYTALINKGKLYLGTSLGFLVMDIRSNNLKQIAQNVNSVKINKEDKPYQVVAAISDKEENIWFATTKDLYQLSSPAIDKSFSPSIVTELTETLPDIRNLEEDSFGNLWIVSHNNGFLRYNPQSKRIKHFKRTSLNTSTPSNKISSVTVDKKGDLWIGTHDKGLLFLKNDHLNEEQPNFQSIEHDPYKERSLSSNLIYSLFVSKSNLLWIGTIGAGINIYDPYRKPFHHYNLNIANNQSSYNTNFIRAVYADKEGDIWIGTHNNGLFLLNGANRERIDKIGFGNEPIFHLNDAGNGNTFVCADSGISLVKKVNGRIQVKHTLTIGPTFYVTKPTKGIFWVASLNGVKKCRLTADKMVIEQAYTTNSPLSISFNNCRVLYFSKETNELFVGTEGGGLTVLHLDKDQVPTKASIYKKSDATNALSNNYIRSIIKNATGEIWIGTYEGLNKMYTTADGKINFKSYTQKDGLPNNMIQSIVEDNQKKIWIGTNQGLGRFEPETETFTLYTLNDGIQSNEFSEHTIFKQPNNEIIIGGINGINTFFPEEIIPCSFKPNTTLTDFYLFNKKIEVNEPNTAADNSPLVKSISLTDSILLKPNQNSIGFDFSAMIFNAPEKIQYAYLLEGFDKEWTVTDASNRKANYTNLSYGDYIFQVKASNNDGQWKQSPKRVFISIKTPFYLTTLAFLLYGFLGILAVLFFTNYSILRYTTKNKIMLENQHNKKIRELEELRTQFFINVSHDLRTPLTLISNPLEIVLKNNGLPTDVKSLLSLMQRNVKKLKDMTEQLLDIRKIEAGSLAPKLQNLEMIAFIKNEASFFKNDFESKGIDLKITSEEENISISFDPDMISKVIFNMLSNALKYTQSGHIAIQVSKVLGNAIQGDRINVYEEYVKIKIEDTGNGIDSKDLAMIFDRFYQAKTQNKKGYGIGLSHSKDLIQAHHGYIEVVSEKRMGTTFSIYLPCIQKEAVISDGIILPVTLKEEKVSLTSNIVKEITNKPTIITKNCTILLVEDNSDLRGFLSQELSKTYQVLEAADGKEGLEIAKVQFPDLIISDIMMPKMDGMEFCKALKSNITTSHIPVILLTAKVDKETKYAGLEIGADDYIAKPFEMEYLFLRISNLIKNRARLRELFDANINLAPSKVTVTSIDKEFLSNLLSKMESGIPDANFSISTLERELGMSHSSFYNKVTSLTGKSAKELLFDMRMKRAKQVLEDTNNIRISEVAYMTGFTDPKYFSKRFKEYFGTSPSSIIKK